MFDKIREKTRDALLRALGLLFLTCCWLLMSWLFRNAPNDNPHRLDIFEFAAAAAGFLCFSAGAALTIVGAHIFDQIEISQRWARSSGMRESAEMRESADRVSYGVASHPDNQATPAGITISTDDARPSTAIVHGPWETGAAMLLDDRRRRVLDPEARGGAIQHTTAASTSVLRDPDEMKSAKRREPTQGECASVGN